MFTENDVMEVLIILVFASIIYYITCTSIESIIESIKKKINKDGKGNLDMTSKFLIFISVSLFILVFILGCYVK